MIELVLSIVGGLCIFVAIVYVVVRTNDLADALDRAKGQWSNVPSRFDVLLRDERQLRKTQISQLRARIRAQEKWRHDLVRIARSGGEIGDLLGRMPSQDLTAALRVADDIAPEAAES